MAITIADIAGNVMRELPGTNQTSINRVQRNLRGTPPPRSSGGRGGAGLPIQGPPIDPGTYLVKLAAGEKEYTTKLTIEPDDLDLR